MADRPKSKARIEEYKGFPVLVLPLPPDRSGKQYDFSFGIQKARAILEYIEEIKDFVKGHEFGDGGKSSSSQSKGGRSSSRRDEEPPPW